MTTKDPTGAILEVEAKRKNLPIFKAPKLTMKVATLIIDFTPQNAPKAKEEKKVGTPAKKSNAVSRP